MDTEERNIQYLNQKVIYTDDGRLLDEEGNAVMMGWEIDIMEDIAKILCKNKGKILNVGFGLGLIDEFIELEKPKEHWIIEAHPDVINYMKKEGWDKKENVICIFDRWQNVIDDLPLFDGIYFDTWEDSTNEFSKKVDNILTPGGKYTFFSGFKNDVGYWKEKGYIIDEIKTKLKNVSHMQRTDGKVYWDPRIKEFIHQILTKPINN